MRDNGFDGLDIDWRYPVSGGKDGNDSSPDDSAKFTLLMSELRGELDYWSGQDNKQYLLTMALTPAFAANYQLTQVQTYVDWINLMSYGFEGDWSKIASPFSPLYGSSKDPRGDKARLANSVEGAVKECLDAGVPADKIVLGVGLYAQAWSSVKPNNLFGMYQPAQGVPAGTRPGGILFYRDLLPLLTSDAYTRYFDNETKTPWLYSEARRVAISYEDQESIRNKASYITETGLGGVMFWELSYDNDAHSLLQTANDALTAPPATPTQ
jgi:chitinase